MKYATLALLAACHAPSPPDGCTAELSGNYVESRTSPQNCPKLAAGAGATRGDQLLQVDLPSHALGSNFAVSLDVGPKPTPGAYNSGTTELWSAKGIKAIGAGACVFLASNNSTPNGDFILALSSIAPLHGTLALRMFVLPRASSAGVQTDCGAGTTEQLRLRF
jgi:hypothetical protein